MPDAPKVRKYSTFLNGLRHHNNSQQNFDNYFDNDFDNDFDDNNALPTSIMDWNDHRHHCHKMIVDYWLMLLSPPPSLLASLISLGKSKYM
jgi:hypothetical protein